MTHQELVTNLSRICPSEVIFEINTENIISAIVRRMGEEALALSAKDLELAREEVKAALEHHLDEREYIDIGLDSWEIIRNLQI